MNEVNWERTMRLADQRAVIGAETRENIDGRHGPSSRRPRTRGSLLDELRVRYEAVQESTDDHGDVETFEAIDARLREAFRWLEKAITYLNGLKPPIEHRFDLGYGYAFDSPRFAHGSVGQHERRIAGENQQRPGNRRSAAVGRARVSSRRYKEPYAATRRSMNVSLSHGPQSRESQLSSPISSQLARSFPASFSRLSMRSFRGQPSRLHSHLWHACR
jgi:hypothetical protein